MGHDNPLLPRIRGGKLSPFLRDKVLYLGQEVSLENASEVLHHLLGVEVSDSTFHRELECYGSMAEEWIRQTRQEDALPAVEDSRSYILSGRWEYDPHSGSCMERSETGSNIPQ